METRRVSFEVTTKVTLHVRLGLSVTEVYDLVNRARQDVCVEVSQQSDIDYAEVDYDLGDENYNDSDYDYDASVCSSCGTLTDGSDLCSDCDEELEDTFHDTNDYS